MDLKEGANACFFGPLKLLPWRMSSGFWFNLFWSSDSTDLVLRLLRGSSGDDGRFSRVFEAERYFANHILETHNSLGRPWSYLNVALPLATQEETLVSSSKSSSQVLIPQLEALGIAARRIK
jgi:hypothetical protein